MDPYRNFNPGQYPTNMKALINGNQHWASHPPPHYHQYQHQTPAHSRNQLNPTVSTFQPTGHELQMYQYAPPSPSGTPPGDSAAIQQMQRLVVHQDARHVQGLATAERMARDNSEGIKDTQEAMRNDFCSLQDQLLDLKKHVEGQKKQAGTIDRRRIVDTVKGPPDEWVEIHGKDFIADLYLEEAEDREEAAVKLRQLAEEISGGSVSRKPTETKLLEASTNEAGGEVNVARFKCCGSSFSILSALLEHVQSEHGTLHNLDPAEHSSSVVLNGGDGSAESTPTHVPPRRPTKTEAEKGEAHAIHTKTPATTENETRNQNEGDHEISVSQRDYWNEDNNPAPPKPQNAKNKVTTTQFSPPASTTTPGISTWQPQAVLSMPPWTQSTSNPDQPKTVKDISPINTETFSWELLTQQFGGSQWSPGFYFVPNSPLLPTKSYFLLEAEWEPYLPSTPGHHGAKLTAFFNNTISPPGEAPEEQSYNNVPVFIRKEGGEGYSYFGNYSQPRVNDKLDYDRILESVPEKVKQYWADQLSDKERPEWVTKELMNHFWPKPTYTGPIPSDDAADTPPSTSGDRQGSAITHALSKYAQELKIWERETRIKAACLCSPGLKKAFCNADADQEPGLRLWWEYLQCVGYDQLFYEMLVSYKHSPKPAAGGSRVGSGVSAVKKYSNERMLAIGGKMVNGKGSQAPETVRAGPSVNTQNVASKPSTNTKGGEKPHSGGQQPWKKTAAATPAATVGQEGTADAKPRPTPKTSGDMAVAKQLQQDFKDSGHNCSVKRGGRGGGGGGGGAGARGGPPHLRGK